MFVGWKSIAIYTHLHWGTLVYVGGGWVMLFESEDWLFDKLLNMGLVSYIQSIGGLGLEFIYPVLFPLKQVGCG